MTQDNSISIQTRKFPLELYLLLMCLWILLASIVVYGIVTGIRLYEKHTPLADAAMIIQLDATTAHLWLEEVLSGDIHESEETVWNHLDNACRITEFMLYGGKPMNGFFYRLKIRLYAAKSNNFSQN